MSTKQFMFASRANHETVYASKGRQDFVEQHQALSLLGRRAAGSVSVGRGQADVCRMPLVSNRICGRPSMVCRLLGAREQPRKLNLERLLVITYRDDCHRRGEGAREQCGLSWGHHESGNAADIARLLCSASCSGRGLEIEIGGGTAGCWAARSHFQSLPADLLGGRP